MPRLREMASDDLSPYLRQHVDNPVDWWTWGEDALGEARRRDVPVFLSVGYAACHWCHVMAHESFADEEVASLLRANFVAVKVDREERPDLDQLYMAAVQLISGHGGWPLTVFLVPDGRPFTGGTYYPPTDRPAQVGLRTLLNAIDVAWRTRRLDVERQAVALERALGREVAFVDHLAPRTDALDLAAIRRDLVDEIVAATDDDGGTSAPRFPRPSYVDALLGSSQDSATRARRRILDAMSRRGLFDHVGGGFARYSVDARWHVPHFEKMLSDQALLARSYFRAGRVDGPGSPYDEVARRTVGFVQRDLRVPLGFAASLDADAAGVEGSHVTWTPAEVRDVLDAAGLGDATAAVTQRWCISAHGDLEGRSVPRLADDAPFVAPPALGPALDALARARARRPQPARDDKVILEWNAMFAGALFAARDDEYSAEALTLLASLTTSHFRRGHWWRTQHGRDYATAADLAWLIDACVDAFEVAGDDDWLSRAQEVAHYLIEHFWDAAVPRAGSPHDGAGFFLTSDQCTDLFTRPKEIFDGATPSSHAVATRALARLALCRGDRDLMCVAQRLVDIGAELLATHPRAVVDLLDAAAFTRGVEVVIPGGANDLSDHVRSLPMLHGVLITGSGTSPLLLERRAGLAYVCHQGWCERPVADVEELASLLEGA